MKRFKLTYVSLADGETLVRYLKLPVNTDVSLINKLLTEADTYCLLS